MDTDQPPTAARTRLLRLLALAHSLRHWNSVWRADSHLVDTVYRIARAGIRKLAAFTPREGPLRTDEHAVAVPTLKRACRR